MGQLWGSCGAAVGQLWVAMGRKRAAMGWGGVTGQGYGVMGQLWGSYGADMGQPWVAMGQLWGSAVRISFLAVSSTPMRSSFSATSSNCGDSGGRSDL